MDITIKSAMIKAHHLLFALSIGLEDKEAKDKCKEMADYLRSKLYDPDFELPERLLTNNSNSAV